MREGIRWRLLDQTQYAFPPWNSVYSRWRAWEKSGFLETLLRVVTRPSGKLRFLDASHFKTHQDACRHGLSYEQRCIGKTKGGLNCKVTAVVEARGRVVAFCLAPGNRHDLKAMAGVKYCLKLLRVVADRGYDAKSLREELASMGCTSVIPSRKNSKHPVAVCKETYKKRHLVENAFQRIKRWRRLGTRYDMLASTFANAITLALLVDWMVF
jgi:transposase